VGSHGIKDKVAIVGMHCTNFGEAWESSAEDLAIEAVRGAAKSTGVEVDDVDAFWLGSSITMDVGICLAAPLQLQNKPVSVVRNFCATGSEALRQAAYAVSSGAYDLALAVGVEKTKDGGWSGLPRDFPPNDGTVRNLSAAAMYSMILPAYAEKYGIEVDELRRTLARIGSKNHANGAKNPLAQFRREVSVDSICAAPSIAGQLGVFDCAGVADGAAAAVVCRAEDAHRYTDKPIFIKALSLVAGTGSGLIDPEYDYTTFPEVVASATDAYAQADIEDPRAELAMAEVHDCFTPTELVLMEDLRFAERGEGWREVEAGTFDLDGELPVNSDGGLKAFGHPVGASGLRMHYECFLQLRGEVDPERAIPASDRTKALVHNLGGYPGEMVSFVSVVGSEPDS